MKIKESQYYRVILPAENDLTFDKLLDLTSQKSELSGIIRFLNNNNNDFNEFSFYNKFFLLGPKGIGKKSLAIAFANAINYPIMIVPVHTISTKSVDEIEKILKKIYKVCNKINKCIIFFDEYLYLSTDISSESTDKFVVANIFLSYIKKYPNIITFASCSENASFPKFIFDEGGFEKKITFNYPELKIREELFKRFCSQYKCEDNINFNSLAKDVSEITGGSIKKIIKAAMQYAINNGRDTITQNDIDEIISKQLYGEKRKKTTDEERKLTAYHESGHAVAGHFSGIDNFTKVDIIHRDESLGLTITSADEDKYTFTKEDLESRIIMFLGGYSAEKIILGGSTTGVSQDLIQATSICIQLITCFGMDEEFGPTSTNIEEANFPKLDEISDLLVQKRMKEYLAKSIEIVENHKKEIEALTNALLEKEVVLVDEMIKIFESVKDN